MSTPTMNFHRRFVSDLERPSLIPPLVIEAPELRALELERRRLVEALHAARKSGPQAKSEDTYVRERAAALREGRDLPPPPPSRAEVEAAGERRRREVAAVEDALLRLGDAICQAVAAHPEWEERVDDRIRAAQEEAEELRKRALDAERRVEDVAVISRWLRRVADGELYVPTFVHDQPIPTGDLPIDDEDPRIQFLIEAVRSGSTI